jgi:hypothetical protein
MRRQFLQRLFHQLLVRVIMPLERHGKRFLQPTIVDPTLGAVMDVGRSKSELIAENAFLRQQLVILRRQTKRPALTLGSGLHSVARQSTASIERRADDCQTRHAARLAWPRLPLIQASQVQGQNATTSCPGRSEHANLCHGVRLSLLGIYTHSRRSAEIRLSSSETHRRQIHPPGSPYPTASTFQADVEQLSEKSRS